MKYDVIISNADLSKQSGNVVLIYRRSEEIFKQEKTKTICILYKSSQNKLDSHSEAVIFVKVKNKVELIEKLKEIKPRKIILYGTKTYLLSKYIFKRIEKPLTIDLQGAFEELVDYIQWFNIKMRVKYYITKLLFRRALKYTESLFVVSDELIKYVKKFTKKDMKYVKFRCGVTYKLTTKEKLENRELIRKKLGISNKKTIYCFSGSLFAWQKIDDILKLFVEIDKINNDSYFVFYCNFNERFLNKINVLFPRKNYFVKYLSFEEYFKYLSACDVGMLIRDNNMTNKVAFPNKFSDYLNAGLLIVTNDALVEPTKILRDYDLVYANFGNDNITDLLSKVEFRSSNLKKYYTKTEQIIEKELLYSEQYRKVVKTNENNNY